MRRLYDRYVLPHVVHFTCGLKPSTYQRRKVVPHAGGLVLEIGIGTGLNLPHYDPDRVTTVLGLEPSREMIRIAESAAESVPFDVEFIDEPVESLPLEDASVDTVVMTYTLCSIPDGRLAIEQVRRVLRPGGRLIFCEHGVAPDTSVRRWQQLINPLWGCLGGGCQLDRDVPGLIESGGFAIEQMDANYIPGWRPASYNYWGSARVA